MLLHYEDANEVCIRSAENIAQVSSELGAKLENLGTVMTLYSRKTFSKESFQWTKCVVKYLYDTYAHMGMQMICEEYCEFRWKWHYAWCCKVGNTIFGVYKMFLSLFYYRLTYAGILSGSTRERFTTSASARTECNPLYVALYWFIRTTRATNKRRFTPSHCQAFRRKHLFIQPIDIVIFYWL